MAHMACVKHGRRITHTSRTTNEFIHRNGDGSKCDSEMFRSGGRKFDRKFNFFDETPEEKSVVEMVATINRIADNLAVPVLLEKGIIPESYWNNVMDNAVAADIRRSNEKFGGM